MSPFVDIEIKQLDRQLSSAQTSLHDAFAAQQWCSLEKYSAQIAVSRNLRFLLVLTKGLDIRLVLLDALVRSTRGLGTRPITTFDRLHIAGLSLLLQRYQWYEDRAGAIT